MELAGYLGTVTFDGETITVTKKARGRTVFRAADITSVMVVPAGIGMRAVKFTVAGGVTPAGARAIGNHKDYAADPYALTFRKGRLSEFEGLVSQINAVRTG